MPPTPMSNLIASGRATAPPVQPTPAVEIAVGAEPLESKSGIVSPLLGEALLRFFKLVLPPSSLQSKREHRKDKNQQHSRARNQGPECRSKLERVELRAPVHVAVVPQSMHSTGTTHWYQKISTNFNGTYTSLLCASLDAACVTVSGVNCNMTGFPLPLFALSRQCSLSCFRFELLCKDAVLLSTSPLTYSEQREARSEARFWRCWRSGGRRMDPCGLKDFR
jgi:hypothetical protein